MEQVQQEHWKNNVVYNKKCCDKIGQKECNQLLARVRKEPYSEANSSRTTDIPHKRTITELGTGSCIFCAERDSWENLCAIG